MPQRQSNNSSTCGEASATEKQQMADETYVTKRGNVIQPGRASCGSHAQSLTNRVSMPQQCIHKMAVLRLTWFVEQASATEQRQLVGENYMASGGDIVQPGRSSLALMTELCINNSMIQIRC